MEQKGQTPEQLQQLINELQEDGFNSDKLFPTLTRTEKRALMRKFKGKTKYGY